MTAAVVVVVASLFGVGWLASALWKNDPVADESSAVQCRKSGFYFAFYEFARQYYVILTCQIKFIDQFGKVCLNNKSNNGFL